MFSLKSALNYQELANGLLSMAEGGLGMVGPHVSHTDTRVHQQKLGCFRQALIFTISALLRCFVHLLLKLSFLEDIGNTRSVDSRGTIIIVL